VDRFCPHCGAAQTLTLMVFKFSYKGERDIRSFGTCTKCGKKIHIMERDLEDGLQENIEYRAELARMPYPFD
jgi:ribosomal protein S27AE